MDAVTELQQEAETTGRALERVPESKFTWKPPTINR